MVAILVVDDEPMIRRTLERKLARFDVTTADCGQRARQLMRTMSWDLVLLDIKLPDADGLDLLQEFIQNDPEVPVLMTTGNHSVNVVVKAMRLGAHNYMVKPFNLDELQCMVDKALEVTALRRKVRMLRHAMHLEHGFERIVAQSDSMKQVLQTAKTVAASDAASVLILGESGTGKNLLAQAIHFNSPRSAEPFVEVTCTALSETLLESELFGHEQGAFTDARRQKRGLCELANRGTLFLDEIGDLPPSLQAKLLGFLENRRFRRVGGTHDIEVDLRVIAATNRSLDEKLDSKAFREDLYYRLSIIEIVVPPLRSRPSDIPVLTATFIDSFNKRLKKRVLGIEPGAMHQMESYAWPGNVRELKNLIERAVILAKSDWIGENDLAFGIRRRSRGGRTMTLPAEGLVLRDVERDLVHEALQRTRGNQTQAAKLLGLSRDQLRYRMKAFDIAHE